MSFTTCVQGPVRCVTEKKYEVDVLFLGTGASVPTRTFGRGIQSIARTSAGLYVIVFANVGEKYVGTLFGIKNTAGTTAGMKVCNEVSYVAATKTLTIQVTDVATPTAADLAAGDTLSICSRWFDTDVTV